MVGSVEKGNRMLRVNGHACVGGKAAPVRLRVRTWTTSPLQTLFHRVTWLLTAAVCVTGKWSQSPCRITDREWLSWGVTQGPSSLKTSLTLRVKGNGTEK